MSSTIEQSSVELPDGLVRERVQRAFFDGYSSRLLSSACLLLALVPLARMSYVVATTGADCITNDDILFVSLTESMLSGTYDWSRYFQDTFINGHCCAAVQALLLILGPAASWNQYTLCFVGMAMAALRAHITARFLCSAASAGLYWPTLAIVSWMLFSFSQVSILTTGIFSVMWQSCLLFMTLGAYLLWRCPGRLSATFASCVLGILACWSLALALPGWLVYSALVILRGAHKKARCMVIAAGAAIASVPYLFFVLSGSSHSRKFSDQYVHWFDAAFLVNALGRTFANDSGSRFGSLPGSELAGTVGLVGFAMLVAVMIGSVRLRRVLTPCLVLGVWSMTVLAMIGVVRSGIAPWYALISAWFWSGLTAASTFVLVDCVKPGAARYRVGLAAMLPCLVLLAVAVWTWQCNKSYIDKQYYLENRTPVSASILRNYEIAPEAFACYVFKLPGLSVAVTGKMLERNKWSVFSRRQTWEMQGDSIFPLAAGYPRGVDLAGCSWIRGTNETSGGDFRSPRHLNLCVHADNVATWRVSLPGKAHSLVLKTAVVLGRRAASTHPAAGWSLTLEEKNGQSKLEKVSGSARDRRQAIRLDLSSYRGKELSILFGNSSAGSAVVFEYPVIEVRRE